MGQDHPSSLGPVPRIVSTLQCRRVRSTPVSFGKWDFVKKNNQMKRIKLLIHWIIHTNPRFFSILSFRLIFIFLLSLIVISTSHITGMSLIYHLAPATRWYSWPENKPYFPVDYEKDGFIHCTLGDELMVKIANRFYRNKPGDYVLLVLDPKKVEEFGSPVKWEEATNMTELFPHIYGGIDRQAVVEVRTVQRADDGTFLGWSN